MNCIQWSRANVNPSPINTKPFTAACSCQINVNPSPISPLHRPFPSYHLLFLCEIMVTCIMNCIQWSRENVNPSPINSNSGAVGNGLDRSAAKTKAIYGCLFLSNKCEPVPNFPQVRFWQTPGSPPLSPASDEQDLSGSGPRSYYHTISLHF